MFQENHRRALWWKLHTVTKEKNRDQSFIHLSDMPTKEKHCNSTVTKDYNSHLSL